jgi:hypothetical protein
MTQSLHITPQKKGKLWLGLMVGWLAQLGLKTFVPAVVLIGIRFLSLQSENPGLWLEDPFDSKHPVWYALQLTIFLSSFFAGALGGFLSGGRYGALALGLAMLSLMTTFFEQFPLHASTIAMWIWAWGPYVTSLYTSLKFT